MIFDIIIVGSGVAGTSAALEFVDNGVKPLILDIGFTPESKNIIDKNLYDFKKKSNSFDLTLGGNYNGLINILRNKNLPPKLCAPKMDYVIRDTEKITPITEDGFTAIQSFSLGGLANAWGAGLYRYNEYELKNFQISESDLSPFYDKLTKEIGISGEMDDLAPFFGENKYLLKSLKLSKKASLLLKKYNKRREKLNKKGIFLGKPRLGVLSEYYNGRCACNYLNLETWQPELEYIYTPSFTLKKLIEKDQVFYENKILVKSWENKKEYILVKAFNIKEKKLTTFKTKKLILAAGTINTTKIVLKSRNDFKTQLKLLDNPLIQIPLVFPKFIGTKLEKNAFGMTQLNMIFDYRKKFDLLLQGSIIELTSPPRSVFYQMFPLSSKGNLTLIQELSQAALVLFLYFPSIDKNSTFIKLNRDGNLEIKSSPYEINKKVISSIMKLFWSFGVITHSSLIKFPTPGYAIHYAGTIPMSSSSKSTYTTDKYGEMFGESGVYIVDGSLFSNIAAKNLSFTIMANSMRIANKISKELKK